MTTTVDKGLLPDLLPCPFCGDDTAAFVTGDCEYTTCDTCLAEGPPCETTEEAARLWNTRTPPQASASLAGGGLSRLRGAFAAGYREARADWPHDKQGVSERLYMHGMEVAEASEPSIEEAVAAERERCARVLYDARPSVGWQIRAGRYPTNYAIAWDDATPEQREDAYEEADAVLAAIRLTPEQETGRG